MVKTPFLFAIAVCLAPAMSWAQTPPPTQPAADVRTIPRLSVGAGVGPMQFQGRHHLLGIGTFRIGLHPHAVLEVEGGRWTEADAPGFHFDGTRGFEIRQRSVTLAGFNVLFRAGNRRLSGFAGGGTGLQFVRDRFERPISPSGLPVAGEGSRTSSDALTLQAVGGADIIITPRLTGFIALRGQVRPDPNLGLNAGMRFVLQSRTLEVQKPTKVPGVAPNPHWARNLALASAAFWGGSALIYCARDCSSEGMANLTLIGSASTAAAAAVGAMINAAIRK